MDIKEIREQILEKNEPHLGIDSKITTEERIETIRGEFDLRCKRAIRTGSPMVPYTCNLANKHTNIWFQWMCDEWDVFSIHESSYRKNYRFTRIPKDSSRSGSGCYWFIRKGLTKEEIKRLFVSVESVTM